MTTCVKGWRPRFQGRANSGGVGPGRVQRDYGRQRRHSLYAFPSRPAIARRNTEALDCLRSCNPSREYVLKRVTGAHNDRYLVIHVAWGDADDP